MTEGRPTRAAPAEDSPGMWELLLEAAAVGGTGVWGVAEASRVGILRLLLDLFPRSSWEAVTWVLVPAVLLVAPAVQGVAAALLGGEGPSSWGRAVAGSLGGTIVALGSLGAAALWGERHLPPSVLTSAIAATPEVLVLGGGTVVGGGWLLLLGRVAGAPLVRRAALPVAVGARAVGWGAARPYLVAWTYALDRPEASGFFVAVAVGGAAGSVWAARIGRRGAPRRRAWE